MNGSQTEELDWLPTKHRPHRGDVVSMVEPAWKIGDTRSFHVVTGQDAGFDAETDPSLWYFVVGMIFCAGLGTFIAATWLQARARARR